MFWEQYYGREVKEMDLKGAENLLYITIHLLCDAFASDSSVINAAASLKDSTDRASMRWEVLANTAEFPLSFHGGTCQLSLAAYRSLRWSDWCVHLPLPLSSRLVGITQNRERCEEQGGWRMVSDSKFWFQQRTCSPRAAHLLYSQIQNLRFRSAECVRESVRFIYMFQIEMTLIKH